MSTVFVDSVDFGEVRIQHSAYRLAHITVVSEPSDPLPASLKLQVSISNNDQAQTVVPPGLGWTATSSGGGTVFEITISDFSIPTDLPLQITDIAAPTSEPRVVDDLLTLQLFNGMNGAPVPGVSATAPVSAQIVDPATAPVTIQLLIDRGFGMRYPVGPNNITRTAALKLACQYGLLLLTEEDWIGVMGMGLTAPVFPVLNPGPYTGTHKTDIDNLFATLQHPPSTAPLTSIAAGVTAGRTQLSSMVTSCACFPSPGALIVLTDGVEGTLPAVSSLTPSSIPTYAIGVGSPSGANPVNTTTLNQLAGGNGYVLVNPPRTALGQTETFAIAKYLIQIIATLRNGGVQVLLDPCGKVQRKKKPVRIPFQISKADREFTVLVLTHDQSALKCTLIGPNGKPAESTRVPGAETKLIFRVNRRKRQQREKCEGVGRWYLEIEHSNSSSVDSADYSVVILADTDLEFDAQLHPREVELGEPLFLGARLSEGGAPISSALAHVFAEVTFPDGSKRVLPLRETSPGSYQAQLTSPTPGLVHARILARGRSFGGVFQREQTLTAHVVPRDRRRCPCCHCHERHGDAAHATRSEVMHAHHAELASDAIGEA